MNQPATLWGDALAPITSTFGLLRAPIDTVVDGLVSWRQTIHGSVEVERLRGGLQDNALALEPLTSGARPRELVVATADPGWTAIFDCGFPRADPVARAGHLASALGVDGLALKSIPSSPAAPGRPQRFGSRQFQMFAPYETEFMNYLRTISVVQNGNKWRFDANGTVQDFEDLEAYERRRIADRFTPEMLVDYSAALGLRPFDDDFYPGPSVLVRNPSVPPPGAFVLSLREAQEREGIVPTR